jgi:hypothetical protein
LGATVRKTASRNLTTLICDDVREEVGHKSTLVGVYQGDLTVSEAPTMLPKLSFFFRARAHVSQPFRSLTVRVLRDGVDYLTAEFEAEALPVPDPADDGTYHVQIVLQAQPFEITGPGELQFVADADGETLDGGRLLIRAVTVNSTSLQ